MPSLKSLLNYWKRELKLLDWSITISWASLAELPDEAGNVQWVFGSRVAHIKILKESDYPKDALVKYQVEESLVHELLHLVFSPFDAETGTLEQGMQEQAINALSESLVKLKYKNLNKGIES